MNRLLLLLLTLSGTALAQSSVPGVTVSASVIAPPALQVAQKVLVQPEKLETRLAPGFSTAVLSFTVLSEVPSEVYVHASDARLVFRGPESGLVTLSAYNAQAVNFVAMAPHSGVLTFTNREGRQLLRVPYTVVPVKTLSQGVSLTYSPSTERGSLSYSVSSIPQTLLAPTWSMSINMNYNRYTGPSSSIAVNMNW